MKILKNFFCILVLSLLIPSVLADGMIYIPHESPMPEKQQLAAINYENGIEKMILTIGTDEIHAENAAWIFPVPANPNDVAINIITAFPFFGGIDIIEDAKDTIDTVIKNVLMTQILPLYFLFMYTASTKIASLEEGSISGYRGDVIIYESIEKEGLTTQIVGAKTGLGLYNYFRNKNIYVDPDSISVFDYYSNKDYTFIVTWISSKKEFKEEEAEKQSYGFKRQVGVEVMFPTDKIYYPLLPTSVYGSLKIPATIFVLDYVKPILYDGIKSFTNVVYYKNPGYAYAEPELKSFNGNNLGDKYTQISINVPSKYFSDDLWMELGAPDNVKYASFISDKTKSLTWILIPILSILTGALVGLFLFKNWKKFALVGLANCLSLVGLIIAIVFIKDKESVGKRVVFVIAFSILFIILAYISGTILKLPL